MWAFSFGSIILSLAHFNSIEMGFNIRGESKGRAHVVHHILGQNWSLTQRSQDPPPKFLEMILFSQRV